MTTPAQRGAPAVPAPATRSPRIIVVMPAYNAARTLEKTYGDLPKDQIYEVILVDDVSSDNTVEVAEKLGLKCLVHFQNKGYGGNQKTCYLEALKDGADVIVMLHPDNQYDATRVPAMIGPIVAGKADMVLGSRLLGGTAATLQGGMPIWKFISNRFLTTVENTIFGTHLSEMHTGYRAYSRRLLETIPFLLNSDDFVFDSEVIAQAVAFGFRIVEVPVPTRYFPEASSVNFRRSVTYGLATLNVARRYLFHKLGIRRYKQFSKRLKDVLARHHQHDILGQTK
ncbi:MAG TPA: glycosyltransferase family 2 protein [Chloroflexia bacterium]|nr:glycosyltransferase family 2 protein [Chloroflexia bacterium]